MSQRRNASRSRSTRAGYSGVRRQTPYTRRMAVNAQNLMREAFAEFLGKQFGGDRDLYFTLGYKKDPKFKEYLGLYERGGIAGRIVDAPAAATWRRPPEVTEDEESATETEFEQAFSQLVDDLKLWHFLDRVDKISGIGRFGVLFLGFSDAKTDQDLKNPVKRSDSASQPLRLLHLQPFHEGSVELGELEDNPGDRRFNMPKTYKINFGEKGTAREVAVHWSRVLHVAEGLTEDNLFGRQRLKRPLNNLDDLVKVVGGSAETYWRAAIMRFHFDIRDDASLDPEDEKALEEDAEELVHNLKAYLLTEGVDAKPLSGKVADPKGPFDVIMDLLSGTTGIPRRILLGSQVGERSSEQDETNWNARITERRENHAGPIILEVFIDHLIDLQVLPTPATGTYLIKWPNLFELDDQQKADTANKIADAISKLSPGAPELVMSFELFAERYLDVERTEARAPRPDPAEEIDENDPEVRAQFSRVAVG